MGLGIFLIVVVAVVVLLVLRDIKKHHVTIEQETEDLLSKAELEGEAVKADVVTEVKKVA